MTTKLRRTSLLTTGLMTFLLFAGVSVSAQIDPNLIYRITARHSGKCLAVSGGNRSLTNGIGVIQWVCIETEENQKWQILPVGFGFYQIVAQHSGKSLTVRGGVNAQTNSDPVEQSEFANADNQKWWFNPVGGDFYQIVVAHSRKSLDINGGPDAIGDGPHAQQWDYWGGANQQWKLTPVTNVVRGTLTYTDTQNTPDGRNLREFPEVIAGCRVEIWRAGRLATTTETDNDGRFSVSVPQMPTGTDTTIIVFATNRAAQVLAGIGPFSVKRSQLSRGSAPLDFSQNFTTTQGARNFNAAQNIRLAFNFAQARRDPSETDVIPFVDVSFDDLGNAPSRYNQPTGGLIINRQDTTTDLLYLHEYAHFLQDKIGGFLVAPMFHDGCFATQRCLNPPDCANLRGLPDQTQLVNSPENAWMEGFAGYFALAVKRANPGVRFNLTDTHTTTEAELNLPPACPALGRAAFDGRTINGEMIEVLIASALWAASSSPGSDTQVFQIFDKELDGSTGRLPTIRLFRDAWPINDRPRLDRILSDRRIL